MEEVDGILLVTLKRVGCDIGNNISELGPAQLIQCVTKCLRLSHPELEVPEFDSNVSMSARYKSAAQIAQSLTDLGYKDEIGCQSFLYPTEAESRKILIFVLEMLPKASEVSDQVDILLAKVAQEKAFADAADAESNSSRNGLEVGGIMLPFAVDVDSLPKETLKFYASHLAELSFQKQREKYRNQVNDIPPPVPVEVRTIGEPNDDDDDFGDADVPEEVVFVKEKPVVPEKPKLKPSIPEKPKVDNKAIDEEAAAAHVKALQESTKSKSRLIKEKEKSIREAHDRARLLQQDVETLQSLLSGKAKALERLEKTEQLLSGDDDALEKVKNAVTAQMEKLLRISQQWETHRKPLVDGILSKKSSIEMSEGAKIREEVGKLKAKLKEMSQEAKSKDAYCNHLLAEYEKLPKDLSRSSYTRRIGEIIGNIKKQKKEIAKVLHDTKELQKEINILTGRLDRTFAVADELIFKLVEKDKNVAQSYKLLVAIHSDFSRIIKTLEEIGNLKRQCRDLEDKLEIERGKCVGDKLGRLKADMTQIQNENRILEAKLRDPTLQRKN